MMNDRELRDLTELRQYYNDMEKRILQIQHLCKFSRDRMDELKGKPMDLACTGAMYAAIHQCLEILRGYADEED